MPQFLPQFSTFNLGEATKAGQDIRANRFRLDETQRAVDVRTSQESALRGDPGAQDMFNRQFPIESAIAKAKTQEQKMKLAGDIIDFQGNIASGITPENYQSSLQRLSDAGVPVDDAPPSYEEGGAEWAQSKIDEANGAEGQLKFQMERLKQKSKNKVKGTALQKNIPTLVRALNITEAEAAEILTQTKDKSPERWRADLVARLAGSGFVDPDDAFKQADKLMRKVFPKKDASKVSNKNPAVTIKPGEKTATDADGNKMVIRGGKWVPAK